MTVLRPAKSVTSRRLRPSAMGVLLGAIIGACTDNARDGAEQGELLTVPRVSVAADTLPQEEIYGFPAAGLLIAGQLWIRDLGTEPFLHVVDTASGRVIRSVGRTGSGPGEFNGVTSIMRRPGDDSTLWMWDSNAQRLTGLPATGAWPPPSHRVRTIPIPIGTAYMFPLGPKRFVFLSPSNEQAIGIANDEGRVLARATFPLPGIDTLPAAVQRTARFALLTGSVVCPRPGGFYIVHRFASRIEQFDSLAVMVREVKVPSPSREVFVRDSTGKWKVRRDRFYYRACMYMQGMLYAIYSGEEARPGGDTNGDGRFIHVFDGETGQLKRIYELTAAIGALVADPDGGMTNVFATSLASNRVFRLRVPPT